MPRYALSKNPIDNQIHDLSDDSEVPYDAAVYIRSCQYGKNFVNLLNAKSKLAELKVISLPLELCGALILSRLIMNVTISLNLKLNNMFLWTDSEIFLSWLSRKSTNRKAFIANRVYEIPRHTENCLWHHASDYNSSELISRNCETTEFMNTNMCWYGPDFLYYNSQHQHKTSNTDFASVSAPETKNNRKNIIKHIFC